MGGKRNQRKKASCDSSDDDGHSDGGDAASPAKAKAGKRRQAQSLQPCMEIPAAKKPKRGSHVLCARCDASSATEKFHMVPGQGGGGAHVTSTACMRCYTPWLKCWSRRLSWTELCGRCADDADFNAAFENTCLIEDGSLAREFSGEAVRSTVRSGYRVFENYAMIPERLFSEATGSTLAPRHAKVKVDKLEDPRGGFFKGVVIQHPDKPFYEVQVYTDVSCGYDTEHMLPANTLQVGQGKYAHIQERKRNLSSLPASMRGNGRPPTLEVLKTKVGAMSKAAGAKSDEGDDDNEDEEEEGEEGASEGDKPVDEGDDNDLDSKPVEEAADDDSDEPHPSAEMSTPPPKSLSASSRPAPAQGPPLGIGGIAPPKRRFTGKKAPPTSSSLPAASEASSGGACLRRGRSAGSVAGTTEGRIASPSSAAKASMKGGGADEMERIADLEQRIALSEILDGASLGDHVYAARRFSPSLPAARLKLQKLLRRANAAEQLATAVITRLASTRRCELLQMLGPTTPCSVAYSQRLLSIALGEAEYDHSAIAALAVPWRAEGEKARVDFNMMQPKVCELSCDPQTKVQVAERLIVEQLLTGLLLQGKSAMADLLLIAAGLEEVYSEALQRPLTCEEFATHARYAKGACIAVRLLVDTAPEALCNYEADMKLVRQMVTGDSLPIPWTFITDALDEIPFWADKKRDFRRAALADLAIGKDMQVVGDALASDTKDAAQNAVDKLAMWISRCRTGGTQKLEEALLQHLGRQVQALTLAEEGGTSKLEEAKRLEQLILKASEVGFKTDDMRKKALAMRKSVKRVSEISSQNVKEVSMLSALSAFASDPSDTTLLEVRSTFESVVGCKFAKDEHLAIIRDGIGALTKKLSVPPEVLNESSDCASEAYLGQCLDDVVMTIGIADLIEAPTSDDFVNKLSLEYLREVWSALLSQSKFAELDTPDDANDDEVRLAWGDLRSRLGAIKQEHFKAGYEGCEESKLEGLVQLQKRFASHIALAQEDVDKHVRTKMTETTTSLGLNLIRLQKVAGGVGDGKCWTDGIDTSVWDEVQAAGAGTLMNKQNKSVARELKAARFDVEKDLALCKRLAEEYDTVAVTSAVEGSVKAALNRSLVTMTEAKVLQLLKDSKMTKSSKEWHIQAELDQLIDSGLSSNDLAPALYDRAMDLLRG